MDIDKLIPMRKSYCKQYGFSSLMDIDKLIQKRKYRLKFSRFSSLMDIDKLIPDTFFHYLKDVLVL